LHHRRPLSYQLFAGQPPTAVISPITLSPPLPGSSQVLPQGPFTPLIPPNPAVNRLMAHHPLPFTVAPPNNLLRTDSLPDQRLNGPKFRWPISPVPPRAAPSSAGFLHRVAGSIAAIVHRLIPL